jgi:hypothetical protein
LLLILKLSSPISPRNSIGWLGSSKHYLGQESDVLSSDQWLEDVIWDETDEEISKIKKVPLILDMNDKQVSVQARPVCFWLTSSLS